MKKYLLLTSLALGSSLCYAQSPIGDAPISSYCYHTKEDALQCKTLKPSQTTYVSAKTQEPNQLKSSVFYKYKDSNGSTVYTNHPVKGVNLVTMDFNSAKMNERMSSYHEETVKPLK